MDDDTGVRVLARPSRPLGGMGETALESVRRLQLTWDGQRSPSVGGPLPVYRTGEVHDHDPTVRMSTEIFLTWCIDAATCRVRR